MAFRHRYVVFSGGPRIELAWLKKLIRTNCTPIRRVYFNLTPDPLNGIKSIDVSRKNNHVTRSMPGSVFPRFRYLYSCSLEGTLIEARQSNQITLNSYSEHTRLSEHRYG